MSLRIAQLTDPHLLAPGELLMGLDVNARLESALRVAEELRPDAYFFTGDFCANEPDPPIYERLRPRLDALGRPYFLVPGNHDDRQMMRAAFPALPGVADEPIYLSATVKDRQFLFLDTSPGRLDEGQLLRLADDLRAQPKATIVMHHPPLPLGVAFMDANYPLREPDRLIELLIRDGRRRRVLCGHYHGCRTVNHENLDIYLCPATSFHINPLAPQFELDDLPSSFQLLEWTDGGDFRQSVHATSAA